jgi:protein-disulfide isomerase
VRAAALLVLAACAGNTKDLETKVDQLSTQLVASQGAQKELERRVDELVLQSKERRSDTDVLEKKIDDLLKKQDQLLAARSAPTRPSRPEPDRAKTYGVLPTGIAVIGKDDAKVTIVWAYDYACPYCEKVRSTIADLEKKYGKDLRVVHKAFVVHPQVATAGALAACAANKQKKFAALDTLLWEKGFKNRQFDKDDNGTKCWDSAAGCPVVLGFAKEAKLDTKKMVVDMKDCQADIQGQMHELQKFGVGATPSFFINGRFLSGAMPIENFETVIDEELAKATDRIKAGTPAAKYYDEWVVDKGEKSLSPVTP